MEKFIARALFSLPSSVLTAMAGGPRTVSGLTLDPRIALMARRAASAPPIASVSPEAARAAMRAGFALIDAERAPGVSVRDLTLPAGDGSRLEARLYQPAGSPGGEPLMVYFHQGGCVLGGVWTCDAWCSLLAAEARVRVLNVDYRHAPEHPFPAAVEDALAAFDWALSNAADLGADPSRVGVGGDSAGGYLSAVLCQARKQAALAQPALQLLIYPCTDWTAAGGSMVSMADAYPLNADMMAWFADQYLTEPAQRTDWRVSPALAPDKSGLSPARIYTAGFDPLTSQAEAYAAMLSQAGVDTLYRSYPTLSHSFTAMAGAVPGARRALLEIAGDVRRAFSA
ncbi:MAG: alpha/beta hydrolase [Alphaproteobacteria bacterium]|nr:alpha/beta hydrolase [Alphaproteobacteria bacterium]